MTRKSYQYAVTRRVIAPPPVVWDVISDHAGMPQWTPFRRAVLEKPGRPHRDGVGAVRSLHLVGPPIREEVLDFDPPHRLRYKLLSGLPFRDYVGEIILKPDGTGTQLSTTLRFRTRIPGSQFVGLIAIHLATRAAAQLADDRALPQVDGLAPHNPMQPPTGWRRAVFRIPIRLYQLKLGWLFGRRILLLNHAGRRTGKPRQTVLEVLEHNDCDGSYVVASGWGHASHWYRNIQADPDITIQVCTRTLLMKAELLSDQAGAEIFLRYASRHRIAARYMWAPMLGHRVDGSDTDFRRFGERIASVRLIPRDGSPENAQ